MLRGYIVLALFCVLAHTAVFNLLGIEGAAVVLAVLLLGLLGIAIPQIVRRRPTRFPWRRLPWAALGYVALALVSVFWSRWPLATLLTWVLMAAITAAALVVGFVLTWNEIVRALSSAMKWIIGLSIALELWVALVRRAPLLPNFAQLPAGKPDPHWYWVRGDLLGGGRIQGIVGNSNTLGMLCVLALIVFVLLFAARSRRRAALGVWIVVALFLLIRSGSATAYASLLAAAAVVGAALLMRRASAPAGRRRLYLVFAGIAVVGAAAVLLARGPLLEILGKSSDLTGRLGIWTKVLERAAERPFAGNGFSSPWVPWDPAFDGWIVDHRITVFMAHDMWLDVLLQLGVIGVVLIAVVFLALVWRSWFFAVDRPRWDLAADRPYSALSLLPIAVAAMLLVQGITESTPIMLWGWLLVVLLSFRLKISPQLTGHGDPGPSYGQGR